LLIWAWHLENERDREHISHFGRCRLGLLGRQARREIGLMNEARIRERVGGSR